MDSIWTRSAKESWKGVGKSRRERVRSSAKGFKERGLGGKMEVSEKKNGDR